MIWRAILNGLSRVMEQGQPYPSDERLAARFRAQQLRILAKSGLTTVPVQLIAGLVVVQAVYVHNPTFCFGWSATLVWISAVAMVRLRRNVHLQEATKANLYVGTAVILIVALVWATLPLVAMPMEGEAEHLSTLLAMACLASAGAVLFQILPIAATGWVLILTGSTIVTVFTRDLPYDLEMSAVAAAYSSIMIRHIWMSSRLFFARLHQTERDKQQSQFTARQAQIGQSVSNCVLLLDRLGRITWVNTGFTRCMGYGPQEVHGVFPVDWLDHELCGDVLPKLKRRLVNRKAGSAELRCRHKNGSWLWLQVKVSSLGATGDGEREYVVVGNDISELKHTAAALHAEKERQRHIIDGTHCGTWEVDFDLGVCKLGGHWLDIIGLDTFEPLVLEGWHVMARMHPEDQPGHQEAIRSYISGMAAQYAHEHRLQHQDGTWHWVSAKGKASLRGSDGGILQMSGTVVDISQSKTTELALIQASRMAKQGSQAKSMFLATMSHEIRTPMNGVIGTAEWLKATRLDEEQRDGIQTIVDSGRSLLTIIDDILDFTKVEAGQMKLEASSVRLVDLVEGVADAIAPLAISKRVTLHLFIDPRLPSHVLGDPNRLRQVLINLVGNAVKFSAGSQERRGQVDVQLSISEDDPTIWQMQISDDGIGMSEETLKRIFSPFTQAEAATTRRFGGTGLGLAICNRLVELMGGGIMAHSVEGHGSTFTVTLPMMEPEQAAPTPAISASLQGVECILLPGQNYRSDTLVTCLEHAGAHVQCCDTLEDARMVASVSGTFVVVSDTPGGRDGSSHEPSDLSQSTCCNHIRHLWIGRYQHGPLRFLSPHVGQLGRAHVQDLLRAVAVLAGRQSPEMVRDEGAEFDAVCSGITHQGVLPATRSQLILIAEDDPTNQKVVQRQLRTLGYACELAGDGQQALGAWRSGRFDLVLSDLHMPIMDGYELAQQIRAEEEGQGAGRVPILALTANALAGEEVRAHACGMDDYLTKPIALKALHQALQRWLPQAKDDLGPVHVVSHDPIETVPENTHVNVDALRQLVGGDEDIIQELLVDFMKSSHSLGVALSVAAANQDPEQVGRIAHQLKSAARSVGADELGRLCEAAEATTGGLTNTKPVDALLQELRLVHQVLDNLIEEPAR